jgi:hypothetical protein
MRTAGHAPCRKLDAETLTQNHHRSSSNLCDVLDNKDSSSHTRTTTGTFDGDITPPPMPAATMSKCIQAASIAQLQLADKGKKAKVNHCIVAMPLKKVAGKQSMIKFAKSPPTTISKQFITGNIQACQIIRWRGNNKE